MASLWLMLVSLGIICHSCNAKQQNQETEFECVSMYKQPALQHPLSKNHQIQIRPSRELLSMLSTSNGDTITKIVLKGSEECPKGQVPIHKPKTNLTNYLFHPQRFKAGRLLKQTRRGIREFDQHYAVIKAFVNTTKKWHGAQALFDINKQQLARNQYTKTWIILSYIQGHIMSSIQFGVAVHPTLYRDNRPRITTLWSEKQQNGCYNALCPGGYVQIHKSIYPGLVVSGGRQHTVHLSVAEDPVTKNWVLTMGKIMIGYWPLQTYMANGASEVYFGGLAGTTSPHTLFPPMGTGDFPTGDLTLPSFMKQLKYVLSDYTLQDINSSEIESYVDDPKCYGVMYLMYVDYYSRETLTFGGPGGRCLYYG